MIVEVLDKASIVGDSTSRPVFTGIHKQLIAPTHQPLPSWLTPTRLFLLLLLITITITLFEHAGRGKAIAKYLDITLLSFQTLVGVLLLYTSTVANLFGSHWNWYLIPFNPLPIVLWLCFHNAGWFKHVYLFYSIVLLLFILFTPFSSQLDLPHQLLTATMAVRTLSHAMSVRKKKQNAKS